MNRKCSECNIKIDINKYKKYRTVCKSCYNENKHKRKKKNNRVPSNTNTASYQQPKIENFKKNNNRNRTLVKRFSNCGKTYLMNLFLLRKQEPLFIITKSLNQYPNIKAQTSDKIQPLENYESSDVVFDDMLLSKQASNIDLFFTRGRRNIIEIYYIFYLKAYFTSLKILFVKILV